MRARLANLEIPGRAIDSVVGGTNGAVYIRGQAVRENDRLLISSELNLLKVGDIVTFETTDRFATTVNGRGEISSIGLKEVIQNFRTILDFHISLKVKK